MPEQWMECFSYRGVTPALETQHLHKHLHKNNITTLKCLALETRTRLEFLHPARLILRILPEGKGRAFVRVVSVTYERKRRVLITESAQHFLSRSTFTRSPISSLSLCRPLSALLAELFFLVSRLHFCYQVLTVTDQRNSQSPPLHRQCLQLLLPPSPTWRTGEKE